MSSESQKLWMVMRTSRFKEYFENRTLNDIGKYEKNKNSQKPFIKQSDRHE